MSKDLYLSVTPTTGGIKSTFWFINVKDVANQDGALIALKAGKKWNTFKGIKFKGKCEIEQIDHKLFSVNLTSAIAHDSPGLQLVMQHYTGANGFLVIYEDLNNYRWLIGTLKQPLKLINGSKSGNIPSSNVGIVFSFSGSVSGLAKFEYINIVEASTPVAPPIKTGVFIKSGSFNDFAPSGSIYQLPTDWESLVKMFGLGYNWHIPTNQTTVYEPGDDADIEATFFSAELRTINGLKVKNSLIDFLTLSNNNVFNNTNRFTDKDGLQVYGDNYIIDHYTGLGWCRLIQSNLPFNSALSNAESSTINGFTDWFVGNINIQNDIKKIITGETVNTNYGPFNILTKPLWSSTTRDDDDSYANSSSTLLQLRIQSKSFFVGYLFCRKHF